TYRYLLALGLVIALGLVTYWTNSRSLDAIDAKTSQLVAATSQEATVYKINSLAHDLDLEDGQLTGEHPTGRLEEVHEPAGKLRQESSLLQQTQAGLLHGDATLRLPNLELSPRLRDIYLGQPQLDEKVRTTGAEADQIVALKNPDSNAERL